MKTVLLLPYQALDPTGDHSPKINLEKCSLKDYIGINWVSTLEQSLHLEYAQKVFQTLTDASNDDAAKNAFALVCEIFIAEVKRRFELEAPPEVPWDISYIINPDGRCPYDEVALIRKVLQQKIEKDVRAEQLAFICNQFWTIPFAREEEREEKTNCTSYTVLISLLRETRKEMMGVCLREWKGNPENANDQFAIRLVSGMLFPQNGFCPLRAGKHKPESDKKMMDLCRSLLRDVLQLDIGYDRNRKSDRMSSDFWKYWMTFDPATPEVILNTFATARAVIGGYQLALDDIEAREQRAVI